MVLNSICPEIETYGKSLTSLTILGDSKSFSPSVSNSTLQCLGKCIRTLINLK